MSYRGCPYFKALYLIFSEGSEITKISDYDRRSQISTETRDKQVAYIKEAIYFSVDINHEVKSAILYSLRYVFLSRL